MFALPSSPSGAGAAAPRVDYGHNSRPWKGAPRGGGRGVYALNGSLAAREINGARQELVTNAKGELVGVLDTEGKTVESYVYDPVGNLLEKVVRGRSTKYEYDAANQLVAQTTDAGTPQEKRVEFAYDGAGRMTREGQREYRYGGLDKVVAVLEAGRTVAEFAYGADGQLASIERKNGEHERLWWRGLALTRRDYLNGKEVVSSERYLNEPHPGGGNPVLVWEGKAAPASAKERAKEAATRMLFNDMLGSTLAVLDGDKAQDTGMTLFGETPDGQGAGFFTGKPHIDELGYAFLFRNYRPDKAKWQTADPLGYPDGWNALAYCNNWVSGAVDYLGMAVLNGSNFSFYSGELDWSVVLQKTPRYYNSQKPTNSDYALYAWCRVHSGYNTPLRVFQARKNMAHYLDNTGTPLIYSSEYVDSFFTISNYAEFENAIAKYVLSIDFTQNSQVTFSTQGKWEDADAIGGNPGILHYLATGGFRYAFSGIAEQKSNFIVTVHGFFSSDGPGAPLT